MKEVVVGSLNPVKINAVKEAFEKTFPNDDVVVNGYNATSQVGRQPKSDQESIQGARNRAIQSLASNEHAAYGVGLEGGIEQIESYWFDAGWCVIRDRNGDEGVASSARVIVPKLMMDKINEGKELGEVVDEVFNQTNSKQNQGHFGSMTDGAVTRTEGYVTAVCLALSRFLHPELFE